MSEAEWDACTDPEPMFEYLWGKVSDRKLNFYGIARFQTAWQCVAALRHDIPDPDVFLQVYKDTRDHPSRAAIYVGLLHDIFGPLPFRPVTINPSWLTPTVSALAQAIYNDFAFDRLPILADALEDAGCTSQDILNHCRGGGEHGRGCWPLDLLLGKE